MEIIRAMIRINCYWYAVWKIITQILMRYYNTVCNTMVKTQRQNVKWRKPSTKNYDFQSPDLQKLVKLVFGIVVTYESMIFYWWTYRDHLDGGIFPHLGGFTQLCILKEVEEWKKIETKIRVNVRPIWEIWTPE